MSEHRIVAGDVTEALIRATEVASELEPTDVLVILYRNIDSEPCARLKYVCTDETTIAQINWMIDKLKSFLIND